PTSGRLTFAPGETLALAPVSVLPDALDEVNPETAYVFISNAINTTIVRGRGAISITDNDPAPPGSPTVSVGDVTVTEGSGAATFTVTLSAPSANAVMVNYQSLNGT